MIFNPGGRWDRCGQSSISGHKFDFDTQAPLSGWTIHITGPGVDTTDVTDVNGFYSFDVPGGQTYLVCEVLKAGWTEKTPSSGAACSGPGEAPFGYSVTVNVDGSCCGGQQVINKDFTNQGPQKLTSNTVTYIHAGSGNPLDAPTLVSITQAPIGSTVHDLAKVTGTGPIPTGNVTFTWWNNPNCSETGVAAGVVALDASGIAHPSTDKVVPVGGGSFKASYAGDANYTGSAGLCEPVEGTKLNSSTVTYIHAGSGNPLDAPTLVSITAGPGRLHRP